MNTTEMLAQLRLNCLLEDSAIDYPDSVLLREMSDALSTKFQDTIVGFRNGTWQASYYQPVTAGQARIRLESQVTVVSKIEIGNGSSANYDNINFMRLPLVSEGHSDLFEASYNGTGQPQAYVLRGNDIVLLPSPDSSGYVLRVTYFRRPPRLFPSQNNLAGTDRGRVTAVNTALRTITVNAVPFNMNQSPSPVVLISGDSIDVVKPNGWFDSCLINQPLTSTFSSVLGIGGTQPLRDVNVGDYVRAFGQSDWPMLPEDFHRAVVDVTTVKILVQRGYSQKATNFAGDVSADLQRFQSLYADRVREEPRIIRAPLSQLRRWRLR